MGSQMCKDTTNDHNLSMDPLSSEFSLTQPVEISFQLNNLLDKIKNIRQIIDPRQNHKLRWFDSKRYGFKLYGQVKNKRPFGECLFYFDPDKFAQRISDKQLPNKNKNPIIITTKISSHYMFSSDTLIIYNDKSYYIGQIYAKKYQIPRATGKGLLVKPQFIYEGQFQQGYPQGYGRIRTKFLEYVGTLKKGLPYGQCIQKTAKGMFIGKIDQKSKIGFLITPENKRIQINQQIQAGQIKF